MWCVISLSVSHTSISCTPSHSSVILAHLTLHFVICVVCVLQNEQRPHMLCLWFGYMCTIKPNDKSHSLTSFLHRVTSRLGPSTFSACSRCICEIFLVRPENCQHKPKTDGQLDFLSSQAQFCKYWALPRQSVFSKPSIGLAPYMEEATNLPVDADEMLVQKIWNTVRKAALTSILIGPVIIHWNPWLISDNLASLVWTRTEESCVVLKRQENIPPSAPKSVLKIKVGLVLYVWCPPTVLFCRCGNSQKFRPVLYVSPDFILADIIHFEGDWDPVCEAASG